MVIPSFFFIFVSLIKKNKYMGCHTWFYKKYRDVSYEEARDFVIKRHKEDIGFYQMVINNDPDEDCQFYIQHYKPKNSDLEYYIRVLTRQLKFIENGYCKCAVMSRFEVEDSVVVFVKDKGYYQDIAGYHDIFRKYGYPETKLFSLEETIAYINDPKNECVVFEYTIEMLNKFWEENPNGMINFG